MNERLSNLDFMLQKVIFCFNYQSNITCRKNLSFISKFCKYLYKKEGNNAIWEPKFYMLRSVLDCKVSYSNIALYLLKKNAHSPK